MKPPPDSRAGFTIHELVVAIVIVGVLVLLINLQSELRNVLTAPGKGPGNAEPTAENICFTIFQVSSESPHDQPLIVTANWKDRELTNKKPYRKKEGFVVFNKGGGGGVYKSSQASSTNIFPVGESDSGVAYRYVPLK
jgi:prepilin-type N-terminal cleavage/methylation domain